MSNRYTNRGSILENIIEINGLNKSFKEVKAVQNLSFRVKKGEFFAFLGVNGAGKSTTISILCGQLEKDGGNVKICGEEIENASERIKRELGVVFQASVLDKDLTVKDNLECRAALYGFSKSETERRIEELCKLLDLQEILRRPVGKLSGGQRRRADIARALLHTPQILILDEPTTGLDPQTRRLIWNVVAALRKERGMTVFLTTHYMEEAAEADYVVILDSGQIAAEGTPLELKNKYRGDFITLYGATDEELEKLGVPFDKGTNGAKIAVKDTTEATALIVKHPQIFKDYEIVKGKMDDVFLAVTGKRISEGGDLR